jgi:hypothetical protein
MYKIYNINNDVDFKLLQSTVNSLVNFNLNELDINQTINLSIFIDKLKTNEDYGKIAYYHLNNIIVE